MRVPWISPLIVAIVCLLANFGGSEAECCTRMEHLGFMMTNGNCGQVNARKTDTGCFVTVCGDGTPLERYSVNCGHGPCNIFGCNCDGGCREGEYGQTFLATNEGLGIRLMHTEVVDYAPMSRMFYTVKTFFDSTFKTY